MPSLMPRTVYTLTVSLALPPGLTSLGRCGLGGVSMPKTPEVLAPSGTVGSKQRTWIVGTFSRANLRLSFQLLRFCPYAMRIGSDRPAKNVRGCSRNKWKPRIIGVRPRPTQTSVMWSHTLTRSCPVRCRLFCFPLRVDDALGASELGMGPESEVPKLSPGLGLP